MKKYGIIIGLLLLGVIMVGENAFAYNLGKLQTEFDKRMYQADYIDVNNDMISDGNDANWTVSGSTGSFNIIMFELAGFASQNIFGIYDIYDPNNRIEIFSGSDSVGDNATLVWKPGNIFEVNGDKTTFSSSYFGYYLTTPEINPTTSEKYTYFSETAKNVDQLDHMLAYQGDNQPFNFYATGDPKDYKPWQTGEYVLAWEDLPNQGDKDFDDFVVMVESVDPAPVPEPATMLLMGIGMLAVAGSTRRKMLK